MDTLRSKGYIMFKQFENLLFNSIVDEFSNALSDVKRIDDKVTLPMNVIHEEDGSCTIEFAAVGTSREDIDVQGITEEGRNFLIIKTNDKELTEEEKAAEEKRVYTVRKIKRPGKLFVKTLVPAQFDLSKTEAKVKDGLLTIKIPALEKKEPEAITFELK